MQDRYDVVDQRSAFLSKIAAWVENIPATTIDIFCMLYGEYIKGKSIPRDA